ncbi:MAG: type sorting protein [Patescibacteria group bacterium]|jgi:hypothetical protein|nr:type sorting protein [Patescibacteria group bacterium]
MWYNLLIYTHSFSDMPRPLFSTKTAALITLAVFSFGLIWPLTQTAHAASTLLTGLTSYWKLDEVSGNRTDSAGGNTLTSTNGVGVNQGKLGDSAQFTAANSQYLSVADNPAVSTGDIDYTLSAWVYLDSKGVNRTIMGKFNTTGNQREFVLYYSSSNDRFVFTVSGNGSSSVDVTANNFGAPALNTWYLVTAWHDSVGNTANISVNDGTTNSIATSTGSFDSSASFTIGGLIPTSTLWDGRIDGAAMWKKALSPSERTELYNAGTGSDYPFDGTDTTSPRILSVSSTKPDGTYGVGEVIDLQVTFTEPVTSTGNITLTLETGTTDRTCLFGITNSSSATCNYTVQNGDESPDLDVSSIAGTIADQSGNPLTSFVPATGLNATKALIIHANGLPFLTNGLASYWTLDEATGTRMDSIGTNHLTSNNNVTSEQGKISDAALFKTAATQSLSIPDNTSLSTGDTDFTLAAWVNLDTKGGFQVIAAKQDTSISQREFALFYNGSSDRFNFSISSNGTSSTTVVANNLGAPAINTWYYVVGWHDSVNNTVNIQVNDTTLNSAAHTTGVRDGTSTLRVGANTENIQFWSGKIDSLALWKRALSGSERTALYNSGLGQEYPFSQAEALRLSSPSKYQVFQRNGSNQGTISISGQYTGTPTSIEASWNGGAYSTITSSPTGGIFTGSLTGLPVGQGTLSVRFGNDPTIIESKAYVGIGDVFVIAGQSNGSGRGVNNQTYSGPFKAGMFGNDDEWKELSDPTDSNIGQVDSVSSDNANSSVWPLVATLHMTDQQVPVGFIPTAKGGTAISQWQRNNALPGDTTTLYGSMYRRIIAAGGAKTVLFWQGESDSLAGTTRSNYKTLLQTYANDVYADFGLKTVVAQIGDYTTQTGPSVDAVRLAQIDAWNEGGNILPGPPLYDVNTTDYVHFTTDAELQVAANRWWTTIQTNFFSGSDARGPRLLSANHNQSKTEITLTFFDESFPLLPLSGLSGFTVKDDGVSVSISSASRVADDQIKLTLSSAASGTLTVSLAEGHSAKGAAVPTDSSVYKLPAETFVDYPSVLDTTPPTISNQTVSPTETGATITWTTDEGSSTWVEYGSTVAYGSATTEEQTVNRPLSHTVTLNNLVSCSTYYFKVHSRDAVHNEGIGTDSTFTTTGCAVAATASPSTATSKPTKTSGSTSGSETPSIPSTDSETPPIDATPEATATPAPQPAKETSPASSDNSKKEEVVPFYQRLKIPAFIGAFLLLIAGIWVAFRRRG